MDPDAFLNFQVILKTGSRNKQEGMVAKILKGNRNMKNYIMDREVYVINKNNSL